MLQEANRILRFVVAAGGKVMGRKRFQKAVHLLQFLGYPLPETFSYHHYGPYSPELQDELDFLAEIGLLEETRSTRGYLYEVTPKGGLLLNKIAELGLAEPLPEFPTGLIQDINRAGCPVPGTGYYPGVPAEGGLHGGRGQRQGRGA